MVSMEADSREKSAAIVNDIIEFANQELATIITSRARRSRIAAQEMVRAAEESLAISQRNMEAFRSETGLLFPEEQGISMVQLMASIEPSWQGSAVQWPPRVRPTSKWPGWWST